MTVRELIKSLQSVDDDILDYEVYTDITIKLTRDVKLDATVRILSVFEEASIDNKRIYLESKVI